MLEDDLVVFENIEYGNAIYILYDDWDEISKLSRIDLLSGRAGSNFDRIIHSGNWKEEVRKKLLLEIMIQYFNINKRLLL